MCTSVIGMAAAGRTRTNRRVVYETSHSIPRNDMIKEVVDWMEKYWGPPTLR